jgi:hypothetical protein
MLRTVSGETKARIKCRRGERNEKVEEKENGTSNVSRAPSSEMRDRN